MKMLEIQNLRHIYNRFVINIKYGLKLNKPNLLLRILINYIKIIFRTIPLRAIDLAPTYSCNMKCEHCFARVLKDDSKTPLTIDDYRKIADEAVKLGVVHIAFQGGEPLLLNNLNDYIKAINPSRFIVSITTNGYFITEEKILEFKKLGVDMLTVSIDSGIPEEHDIFRGINGAFDKAMNAVMLALKNRMNVCINTLFTRKNIYSDGINRMIKFCDKYGIKLTAVLPAMVGNWQEAYDLMLDKEAYKYLEELMKEYPFIRRDLDSNYWHWGCGAVKEMIYISAYGDVFPCSFIHCTLGNIKKEPLSIIRKRGLKIKEFNCYHSKCLVAEDSDFIKRRLRVTTRKSRLPVEFVEMFPEINISE